MTLTLPRRRRLRTAALAAAGAAVLAVAATGCGSSSDSSTSSGKSSGSSSSSSSSKKAGSITVLGAASLKESFTELGNDWTKKTGTKVQLSFAGSQQLAAQVKQGAPADVIATADTKTMKDLGSKVESSKAFATNRLVIAVRPGNPKHIKALADLDKPGVTLVLAADQVPAGRYAKQALDKAGVKAKPKSKEPDVRSAMTKVKLGEADAAIVYRTDAESAKKDVQAVAIPDKDNVQAVYPIAPITASSHQSDAKKFAAFVAGSTGTKTLENYGFGAP